MHCTKKWNTSGKPYRLATSHQGLSALCKANVTTYTILHNGQTTNLTTQQQQQQWIKQQKHVYSGYLTSTDGGKGSKGHATTWGSKCISKGPTPLKLMSWLSRTGTIILKKSDVIYRFICPHMNYPEGIPRGIRQNLWGQAQGIP